MIKSKMSADRNIAYTMDKDHPTELLVNLIWSTIRKERIIHASGMFSDTPRMLMFRSNSQIEYVRPAPTKPRISWIDTDRNGYANLPENCFLGQIYVQMPSDFNSKRETVEAYMCKKRFLSTTV